MARIGPPLVVAILLAGCGFIGAAEISVDARNDSDFPMRVQVVDADGAPHGPVHTVEPLEERTVELAVPGGQWSLQVNGRQLMDSSDAAGRVGRLPATLVAAAPDEPGPDLYWEAPIDWAGDGS
jgi:hypothetical protein